MLGPSGLLEQDIIYEINNCSVKHSDDWYDCILSTVNQSALGYCVKQSFIQVIIFFLLIIVILLQIVYASIIYI